MQRFSLTNKHAQRFEEGRRVRYQEKTGIVLCLDDEQQKIVQVRFDDGTQHTLPVDELESLTHDKGHCHGCGRYTTQVIYPTNPQHHTKRPFGWECTKCRFINSTIHVVTEEKGRLKCHDCNELCK